MKMKKIAFLMGIASCLTLVVQGECDSRIGDHTPKKIFYSCCNPPQKVPVTAPITCCDAQTGSAIGYADVPEIPCDELYPRVSTAALKGSCANRRLADTKPVLLIPQGFSCGGGSGPGAGGISQSTGGEGTAHQEKSSMLLLAADRGSENSDDDCPPGAPTWRMNLGNDASGNYLGHLEIDPAQVFAGVPSDMRILKLETDDGNPPDVSYDGSGNVFQIMAKECFVMVTTNADSKAFDVSFYHPQDVAEEMDEAGMYVLVSNATAFVSYHIGEVVSSLGRKSVSVSERRPGVPESTVELFVRDEEYGKFWGALLPDGATEKGIRCDPDGKRTEIVRCGSYESRVEKTYNVIEGVGSFLLTRMRGEGPLCETNAYSYAAEGGGGVLGAMASSVSPAGLRTAYVHQGSRVAKESAFLPGDECPFEEKVYSYEPLGVRPHCPDGDGTDIAYDDGTVDVRTPRSETLYRFGVVVSKTLRFLAIDTAGHRIIEEIRLADPTSSNTDVFEWNNSANVRTYTDYMPYSRCKPCSELPSLVMHEDGCVDRYAYSAGEYSNGVGVAGVFIDSHCGEGDWFRTVVTHYAAGDVEIPNVTTRDVKIEIRSSKKTLLQERYVCTAPGEYARVSWTATTRDDLGQETRVVKSDGTRIDKTYVGRRLASMTDAEGLTTTYAYDALGRVIAETKSGGGVRPDTTTTTTYDPEDRVLSRTVTAGGLSETETYAYDALGRRVTEIDAAGVETRYLYATDATAGLETRTTIRAFGTDCAVTNTTISYADGRTKETRLNGIVKTAYEYGPNWTKAYEGPSGLASPRWSCSYEDALGRTICETRPGFRGVLLITSNEYNTANQLVATRTYSQPSQPSQPSQLSPLTSTCFCYNNCGERNLTVSDMNLNGQIDWNDTDRIVSNDTRYVSLNGDWWRESSTWQTRQHGSSELTRVSCYRERLDDAGEIHIHGFRLPRPNFVSFDIHGNETAVYISRNRTTHTVARTEHFPTSSSSAQTVVQSGLTVSSRSATGVTTTNAYDALGRQISQTDGRGNTSHRVYDAQGRVAKTIDALGNETTYTYDALGRQIAVTDPLGHTITTTYDAEDHILAQRGATYPVDYAYDVYGNKVSMTTYRNESLADGDTTHWLYDEPSGCMTNKLYADGKGPSYSYTPDGKLARRTWARGIVTDYTYDNAGNLTRTEYNDNGVTPTITMSYDRVGNLVNATTAGVVTNLYVYDIVGNCTNEWQNDFNLTRYYDTLGRSTGYAINGTRQTTIAYDTYGRIATMTTATGGALCTGAAAAKRSLECCVPPAQGGSGLPTASNGGEFTWTYLPGSDLKSSLSYPNGLTASWQYDANNQLLQVRNATPTNVISQFDYTYDAVGRRVSIAKSGTAFGDLSGSIDSYAYNTRSELISARRTKNGQPIPGFSEDFDYDPIGNRRSSSTYNEKGEAQTSTYLANNLNQYTSRTSPGYAAVRGEADPNATVTVNERPAYRLGAYFFGGDVFDNSAASGLANLETYATLAQTSANGEEAEDLVSAETNQVYLAQSPETFAYDDDGNQTLITTKTGLWRVTYNGENRPILWVRDSDNATLTMSYDHMGRRRQKNTQHFFYDGYLQIANFHSPTQTHNTNYFIWEPTELIVTRPLVWGKAAPDDVEYYMHDGNKNVACVIYGQDIIAVAACYEYASFGGILSYEGALAVENPFRFSSEFCDDDVCLSYYNYRHCDSICGRWICRDRYCEMPTVSFNDEVSSWLSLDYGSSLNLYKCGNDLIGFVDVYGLIAAPPNNPKPEEQNVFQEFDPVDSDVGALQRLIAAEVPLPGVWKQKNISKEEAERNVNALLWCLCNRQRMHALGKWKSVVSEVEDGVVQWKHFDKYPTSYNKFVRRRIAEFQRLAEKGHNKVKGFAMYYDFWQLIRDKVKNLDCETQKSGFEDLDVFKQNYKKECSVCYMRTAGAGNSVGGSVTLGTVGNNTFTIKNVERR